MASPATVGAFDPDAVEDADLDDLREQVAALTRTVEHFVTREHEFRPSQEVVAEVAEAVVDDLERRGDRDRDADGGPSRGFY